MTKKEKFILTAKNTAKYFLAGSGDSIHNPYNENRFQRAVRYFSPRIANKNTRATMDFKALKGGYHGGSRRRDQTRHLKTTGASANTIFEEQGGTLRERSADLEMNNGFIAGAVGTTTTAVVGGEGLKPNPQVRQDILGLSNDKIKKLNRQIEDEWILFANSKDLDRSRISNYAAMCNLASRGENIRGDIFFLFGKNRRPGRPYDTTIMAIEADRVSTPFDMFGDISISDGIQVDKDGVPSTIWISEHHPGEQGVFNNTWFKVNAFSKSTGRPNILHHFHQKRPGQNRGVPTGVAGIEDMLMGNRYKDSELVAANRQGDYVITYKTDTGEDMVSLEEDGSKKTNAYEEQEHGLMLQLSSKDDFKYNQVPSRPNSGFGDFMNSIVMGAGAAREMPFEVFRQKYDSSFSASQAALMQAWQMYKVLRHRLIVNFCLPLYSEFFHEAVSIGRIDAPGFFTDPLIKLAYLWTDWVGPAKPNINELVAVTAAEKRVANKFSTSALETKEMTGQRFDTNVEVIKQEEAMVKEANAKNSVEDSDDENNNGGTE